MGPQQQHKRRSKSSLSAPLSASPVGSPTPNPYRRGHLQNSRVIRGMRVRYERGRHINVVEKFEAHIADAVKIGARVAVDGKRSAGGAFFEPTVLTRVTTDMVISQGGDSWPGGACLPLQDRRQRHKMANDTKFGLAATSAASGGRPRGSNTPSPASTKASSRPRSPRSAG